MTSLINDSVALAQVLSAQAGGRLPLSTALYACSEVARLVAAEHEMGHTVTGLDLEHVRCTKTGGVILTGARVHHPDARADVHAVGVIFYNLLTGKGPAARDVVAPSHFNPGVDSELDAVILAALAKDPSLRPSSLRVLEGALSAVFEELELTPAPEELAEVVARIPLRPVPFAMPKAVAPVVRPIIVARPVHHAPPAGWYASEADTIDEDGDENELEVSTTTAVPSWQAQERERKLMVGISAAMVLVALLWALWPAPKNNRASLEETPAARVTARR